MIAIGKKIMETSNTTKRCRRGEKRQIRKKHGKPCHRLEARISVAESSTTSHPSRVVKAEKKKQMEREKEHRRGLGVCQTSQGVHQDVSSACGAGQKLRPRRKNKAPGRSKKNLSLRATVIKKKTLKRRPDEK